MVVQSDFWQFLENINGKLPSTDPKDHLCRIEVIRVGNKVVSFHAYNTAWMSQLHESQGSLLFPIEHIPAEEATADLVVSLFHHPYNWLESTNARVFRTNIERMSDLILTGHEHESGQHQKINRISGETNEYVEGGVLQDSGTKQSEFNAILIDLDNRRQKFIRGAWSGTLYKTEAVHATWQDFQRNKNRTRNEFVISAPWTDYLTSPGAAFTHSRKEKLELKDIFVEPNVRELSRIDSITQVVQLPINGDDFWRRLVDTTHAAILGGQSSGKTALGKSIYLKFHAAGFVPLTLSGEEIKTWDREKLMRQIAKAVQDQYSAGVVERYWQIGPEKRVLLIDNYHLIPLNNKGNQELFAHLKEFASRIILLTHDLSKVDELAVEGGQQNPLATFIQFELQEFGNQLREELIERWFTIGQEYIVSSKELETQVIETKRIMDALLGRNLLPAYPIFILIILQQIEAQTNLNASGGALGYLYEHLITASLAKTAKRLDLDTAYAYLSEVAYHMFGIRARRLNEVQMSEVHQRYCDEYKMNLRFDQIEKALVEADLLITQ